MSELLQRILREGFLVHEKLLVHLEWRPRHSLKFPRLYVRPLPRGGDVTEEGVLVRCFECGGEGVLIDPHTETALPVEMLPKLPTFIRPEPYSDPTPSIMDIMRANGLTLLHWREEQPVHHAYVLGHISFNEYIWRRLSRDYTGLPQECYERMPF